MVGPSEEDAGPCSFIYVSKLGYEVLVALVDFVFGLGNSYSSMSW